MIRKVLLSGAAAAAFSALVSAGSADATTITFPYANGTPVTTIGIATFSLIGGPEYSGSVPVTGSFGYYGFLGNSPTGEYPTSEVLDVSFSSPVKDISFFFDNFGTSYYGRGASTANAYGPGATLLGTTFLGGYVCGDYGCSNSVAGSGVVDLQFNNGTGGGSSWEFGLSSLSFDLASSVPEPTTWAMMLGGFGFLGFVLRRRLQRAARAA